MKWRKEKAMEIREFALLVLFLIVIPVGLVAQNPVICASISSAQTQTGGENVTSFGTVKALFIFIDFSDHTFDPNNTTWPV